MRKVDIIWNTTLVCPWDCAICCVDAVHVTRSKDSITMRSQNLSKTETIPFVEGDHTIFEQAVHFRQDTGYELSLEEKFRVLDHLDGFDAKIDFSGGDPLVVPETVQLIREAAERFGVKQVTLTATGAGLSRYPVDALKDVIGELNFTYDGADIGLGVNRPKTYASGNFRQAQLFAAAGVKTRAECPLTIENVSEPMLEAIYKNLHDAGIDKLLIMRLFNVGRGQAKPLSIPSPDQYRRAISFLRNLESKYGRPKVKLQCALKFFDDPEISSNPCDMVEESFGLMADGTLLASPWAINLRGEPLDESWVLGNLARNSLKDILSSAKVQSIKQRRNENFGLCKIHAFLNSKKQEAADRMFDISDPLYSSVLGVPEETLNA